MNLIVDRLMDEIVFPLDFLNQDMVEVMVENLLDELMMDGIQMHGTVHPLDFDSLDMSVVMVVHKQDE